MSAIQYSTVSSLESKMDADVPKVSKVVEAETGGLDGDEDTELITLYLLNRANEPVFRMQEGDEKESKVEFKLTKQELSISRMFFEIDKEGNAVTSLQDLDEDIPISMSWATGSNSSVPNPYTVDDAIYALSKCVEWMKHFKGFSIGVIGQIPGTSYITSLRSISLEEGCRGLDPRTHGQLAEKKMRMLVREKLLTEIRKLKGMSEDGLFGTCPEDRTHAENRAIYEMREKVERESPYIKWLDETLERTKQEEEKFFKENPPWFLTWIKEIMDTATFTELCGVMSCASYLDIKPLVYLSGAAIATILRHKTKAKVAAEIEMRNKRREKRSGKDEKKEDSEQGGNQESGGKNEKKEENDGKQEVSV